MYTWIFKKILWTQKIHNFGGHGLSGFENKISFSSLDEMESAQKIHASRGS